jgi:uncharacterized protein YceK
MNGRLICAGAAVAATLMLANCATISTLSEDETKNKVLSGTIRHGELKCAHGTCLDFPFSLVADVLLLPITIPWSLVNAAKSSGAESKEQVGNPPNSTVETDARKSGARGSP